MPTPGGEDKKADEMDRRRTASVVVVGLFHFRLKGTGFGLVSQIGYNLLRVVYSLLLGILALGAYRIPQGRVLGVLVFGGVFHTVATCRRSLCFFIVSD